MQLAHAFPTMHCIPLFGANAASPTLVMKMENCLHVDIYMFGMCVFRIYIWPNLCAMQFSTLHVDKTSRTERLNSGNQHNRDLKMVRKGYSCEMRIYSAMGYGVRVV